MKATRINATSTFFCSAILLLGACGAVHAGAKDDVGAAMQKFAAARSYHATMTTTSGQAMTMELDFVAPDRYRIKMPMGTQVIIGGTMYMNMQGRTMKLPMPKDTLSQWRDPGKLREAQAQATVTALGPGMVDGKPASKYRIVSAQSPDTASVMWIGAGGWPLKIDVEGKSGGKAYSASLRYSRFNDPTIRIDAPQ